MSYAAHIVHDKNKSERLWLLVEHIKKGTYGVRVAWVDSYGKAKQQFYTAGKTGDAFVGERNAINYAKAIVNSRIKERGYTMAWSSESPKHHKVMTEGYDHAPDWWQKAYKAITGYTMTPEVPVFDDAGETEPGDEWASSLEHSRKHLEAERLKKKAAIERDKKIKTEVHKKVAERLTKVATPENPVTISGAVYYDGGDTEEKGDSNHDKDGNYIPTPRFRGTARH